MREDEGNEMNKQERKRMREGERKPKTKRTQPPRQHTMTHRPAKTRAIGRPMRRNTRASCLLETMNTFTTPSLAPRRSAPPGILIVRRAKIDRTAPNFRGRISGRPGRGYLSPSPPRISPYHRNFIPARSSPNFESRIHQRTHDVSCSPPTLSTR